MQTTTTEPLTAFSPQYIRQCVAVINKAVERSAALLSVAAARTDRRDRILGELAKIQSEAKDILAECDTASDHERVNDALEQWCDVELLVDTAVDYVTLTDREQSVATEHDYDRLRRAVEEYVRK